MVNQVDGINLGLSSLNTINNYTEKTKTSGDAFEMFLNASKNLINETNQKQLNAEQAQIDFVTGKNDDLLSVVLAQKSAATSLNYTVQITNKVLDSYRTLMQVSI
ncbi:MAG: flagellar hook-basal body complex protein FliE [Lachnospirales bacterium]